MPRRVDGVTPGGARLLEVIQWLGPISVVDAAEELGITRQVCHQAIIDLRDHRPGRGKMIYISEWARINASGMGRTVALYSAGSKRNARRPAPKTAEQRRKEHRARIKRSPVDVAISMLHKPVTDRQKRRRNAQLSVA